jgi:hypothetical protein
MLMNVARLAIGAGALLLFAFGAQGLPVNGLYQIRSGAYSECCGLVGVPIVYSLPSSNQAFVRFTVEPQNRTATMTFLGNDGETVFSRVPCLPSGQIPFDFPYGFSLSDDSFVFHVDPGPPPYQMYWNYTASNSPGLLRIDGTVGTATTACADTPTHFNHSNIVAVLVAPPRLSWLGFSTNGTVTLMIQGTAGQTNIVEASGDLSAWIPVGTNIMDYSACPICPYATFEDIESTNLSQRFYRVFQLN